MGCVTVYYGITAIKPETTFVVQQNVTLCRSKFRTFSKMKPCFLDGLNHQTTALYTIVTNCFSVPPFGLWSKPDPQYVGSIFQDTLPQTQSPFPIKVTGYNLSMQDLRHVPLPHITNTNGKPPTLCTVHSVQVRVHILIPFTHKNVSLKPQ